MVQPLGGGDDVDVRGVRPVYLCMYSLRLWGLDVAKAFPSGNSNTGSIRL